MLYLFLTAVITFSILLGYFLGHKNLLNRAVDYILPWTKENSQKLHGL